MPTAECVDPAAVAAELTAAQTEWRPKVRNVTCRCASGRYYMSGWRSVDDHWVYEFVCSRVRAHRNPSSITTSIGLMSNIHALVHTSVKTADITYRDERFLGVFSTLACYRYV